MSFGNVAILLCLSMPLVAGILRARSDHAKEKAREALGQCPSCGNPEIYCNGLCEDCYDSRAW